LGSVAVDPAAPTAARPALRERLRGFRRRGVEVVLRLPSAHVLRRRIELPLAAAENLREVLGFEMDRLTPFKAEDVAYDFRVAATDREAQRMSVELAVAPRAVIDEAVRVVNAVGLAPDRVAAAPRDSGDEDAPSFNLLAPEATSGRRLLPRLNGVLALAVCVLLAALALWPLQRKEAQLADLEARLAETRAAAAASEELRRRIDAALKRNSFLAERRQATPLAVAVLADLTQRLADDTWLVQLHVGGGEASLSGYAPSAAALIPALEASALLDSVRFDAPVMPDPRVGRERFNLSARIAGAEGS
jgi:general secretion pathway protein L